MTHQLTPLCGRSRGSKDTDGGRPGETAARAAPVVGTAAGTAGPGQVRRPRSAGRARGVADAALGVAGEARGLGAVRGRGRLQRAGARSGPSVGAGLTPGPCAARSGGHSPVLTLLLGRPPLRSRGTWLPTQVSLLVLEVPLSCLLPKRGTGRSVPSGLERGRLSKAILPLPTFTEAAQNLHSDLPVSSSEGEPVPTATAGSRAPPGRGPPHAGVLVAHQRLPPGHMEAARPGVQPFRPCLPGRRSPSR